MESLAAEVRSELQGFFEKPKLSDKLLSKPPFRFLHDIVGGLHKATGFAADVYQGEEWDSRAMNASKETKAAFMDKLVSYVTDMTGEVVEADRNKILAGKEPEQTAKMLLQMGKVARGLAQGAAAKREQPAAQAAAAAAPEPASLPPASEGKAAEASPPRQRRPRREEAPPGGKTADPPAPTAAAAHGGGGGGGDAFQPPEAFGADGSFERTRELLQPLFQKPVLSDKHLGRPPLRFLHDILTRTQAATGWAQGLLPAHLAESAAVKEKANKAEFLELFINAVALDLCTFVPADPAAIMAGKEAPATNVLLQLLGVAAQRGSGADAVAAVHAGQRQATSYPQAGAAPAPAHAPVPAPAPAPVAAPAPAPAPAPAQEEPWAGGGGKAAEAADEDAPFAGGGGFDGEAAGGGEGGLRSARPQTARRRPPKARGDSAQGGRQGAAGSVPPAGGRVDAAPGAAPKGLMVEGADEPDSDDEQEEGGENVFGGGASGPKGGAGKLTREILGEMGEGGGKEGEGGDDDGIRFGRIKRKGGDGAFGPADVQELRRAIQRLVQSTNPLGKSMDYVQSDVDEMKLELGQWRAERKRHADGIARQARDTRDALQPQRKQLLAAEEACREMERKITAVRASIAKNDDKLHSMVSNIVTRTG